MCKRHSGEATLKDGHAQSIGASTRDMVVRTTHCEDTASGVSGSLRSEGALLARTRGLLHFQAEQTSQALVIDAAMRGTVELDEIDEAAMQRP